MQQQNLYNRLFSVVLHVLVWAVFGLAIFYYQPVFSDFEVPYQFWLKQTVELGMLVVAFYLNSFVLVPRLLLKNNLVPYLMIVIIIVLAIAFGQRYLDRAYTTFQFHSFRTSMQQPGHHAPSPPIRNRFASGGTMLTMTITALVMCISTAITGIQKWQKDNQARKELEKDKATSELSFLKAQIHPHFFFNTLNNIYVLTEVDPKLAGEAIHQLSKMMRYLLYDTQHGDNMLSQEIAFVNHYISLMKLRLTDVVKINIDIPAKLRDMPLAPMIFLPFVENAFKHGVSTTQESYINIAISQKDKVLDLVVRNSINKDNVISLEINSGIGLANTRRRLDLLYPGRYKLETSGSNFLNESNPVSEYSVHLVLDLS